jgi:multidrug efflux pump subunit AcrA (membrane-fusion protein)
LIFRKEFYMFGRASSLTGEVRSDRRRIRAGSAVMAILLCAGVSMNIGCQKQEQTVVKERAVNVRVWTAETRSLRPFVESIGTLKPYEEVTVSSEVDGILKSIHVDEGAPVSRGQLVAEIKDIDYRLAEEQATAALKQAQASLANAKLEYQRKEALYRRNWSRSSSLMISPRASPSPRGMWNGRRPGAIWRMKSCPRRRFLPPWRAASWRKR